GWTGIRTIAPLGASAVLFGLFGLIEAHSRGPLVPLRIFRARTLVGGNLVLLTVGMSVDGTLLIITFYAQEVLGYSAVQFGLMTAVMTVTSAAGAYAAQAVVTRAGVRPVGAAGMTLVGTACLLLTQVSVNGSYWPDLFFGLLVFGAGLGSAFVAPQIAALTPPPQRQSGLAAGLADSSFNIGSALGIAILSTVAVARAGPEAGLHTMTEGFQAAFAAAAGIALLGALLALLLLRPRAPVASTAAGPVSAPDTEPLEER